MRPMSKQIISKSDLFRGQIVDEPMTAVIVGEDADGDEIYACPACGQIQTSLQAYICGSEPGAAFCWKCNQEFYL